MSQRWKPSVTVAAIVAGQIDGRLHYLLVEEHTPEGLMLNNPAGHLDPEESPLEGVVREALEETTRVFTPDCLVGVYMSRFQRHQPAPASPSSNPGTLVEDVTYLRFAYGGSVGEVDTQRSLDHGIVRTVWMTIPELQACRERHRSALVLQCIEDHAAGRRFPLELVSVDPSLYSPEIKSRR